MAEVNISYETLFELLRRERDRGELQSLDDSFTMDVCMYVKDKTTLLQSQSVAKNAAEADRIREQISSTKKLIKELYERRERKILNMALYKSRVPTAKLNTAALLPNERKLFDEVVSLLTKTKRAALDALYESGIPKDKQEVTKDEGFVEFLEDLPKFIGPNLAPMGPFRKGERAALPPEIRKILLEKGQAKLLEKAL